MTSASASTTVRLDALVIACAICLTTGLAGAFGWRWFSLLVIDVPASLASMNSPALVLNTVVPALGNSLGYFLAYRRAPHRSDLLFVVPAIVLAGVGVVISLAQLTAHGDARAVAVTTVATLITPAITVAVLMTLKNYLRVSALPVRPFVG